MFKYLLLGLVGYWILKRVFRINDAVKSDKNKQKENDNHGGDYVDYEEVE